MALFGRNYEDELDNNYLPLEEFAPTISRQEVVKRKKLSDLITPIRDIPTALKGRRNQIENDLNSFSLDQDESFEELEKELSHIAKNTKGHINDVGTLSSTILKVRDALSSIQETTDHLPKLPEKKSLEDEIDIPSINLPKLSEEYMPDPELVNSIRSYSSFSDILKKSVEYTLSSLDQYHVQVKSLSKNKEMLESCRCFARIVAAPSRSTPPDTLAA